MHNEPAQTYGQRRLRRENIMKTALTIAGSDSSGGAGIQADIKTMTMNGVFAMSAITALTAQNTTGVSGIMNVPPEFLAEQLDEVFTDIPPDAVKIGMVSASSLIETIAGKLQQYKAVNIVVDPVMVATSGAKLISDDAIDTLKSKLLPLASILTPNVPETEVLAEMPVRSAKDMEIAAKTIHDRYGCAVLCKGGHRYARHRMHPVFRDRGKSCQRVRYGNFRSAGEGVYLRSFGSHAGSGEGQRPYESRFLPDRRLCRGG